MSGIKPKRSEIRLERSEIRPERNGIRPRATQGGTSAPVRLLYPWMSPRRATAALLVSIVGHACLLAGLGRGDPPLPDELRDLPLPSLASAADHLAIAGRLKAERRALVEQARADRQAGKLSLGRFLLQANRIDAEEIGQEIDSEEALARYAAKVAALREALKNSDVTHAAPEVFGELKYHGQPGGLMGSALLDGGGSCEQIAQLVASAVFDAGRPEAAFLRFYGAPMSDGVAHLSPVALEKGEERDLMSGRPALLSGKLLPVADLIEIYARAHGLSPREPEAGGGRSSAGGAGAPEPANTTRPERPTLFAGFPPNHDRYPGSLPLYAARALKEPTSSEAEEPEDPEAARERARSCAYFLRMAMLQPPLVEVLPSPLGQSPGISVEPRRVPSPLQLEREAALLNAAEDLVQAPGSDEADRIMGLACLAALGEVAAVDFTLARERRSAEAAIAKRVRAREEGRKAIEALLRQDDEAERVAKRLSEEFGGRAWLLLALEGGDELVLQSLTRGRRDNWGRVSALAALVLWPATQARALALVERLPIPNQVNVMHEVFHAHDHMRPWATNVDLGAAPAGLAADSAGAAGAGATFRRAYGVFRALAFRLWEAQRDVNEIFSALREESRRAGLDAAWEAALLEYCGRNALGLYSQRDIGMPVAMALKDAVRKNGHPSLEALSRQLDYIELQGRLDARTLADAMRLP